MRRYAVLLYADESWAHADLFERLPTQVPKTRATLALGADGLSVQTKAGSSFISYDQVIGVEVATTVAVLTIRFARREDLAFISDSKEAAAEAQSIASEVRSFIAAFREAASRASQIGPLVSGMNGKERLAAVRALVSAQSAPYRTAARTREDFWIVATSPATPESERLGAIVALRFDASKDEKMRLASIGADLANEVTAQRVRVAVEGDEAALEALFPIAADDDAEVESTLAGRLRRRRR